MLSSTLKKLERKFFYMVVMKSYLSDLQSTWSQSRSRSYFWRAGAGAGARAGAEKIERLRNTALRLIIILILPG